MASAGEISDDVERLRSELRAASLSLPHTPQEERRDVLVSMWGRCGLVAQALQRYAEIYAAPDPDGPRSAFGRGGGAGRAVC